MKAKAMQFGAEKKSIRLLAISLSASLLLNSTLIIGPVMAAPEKPAAQEIPVAQDTSAGRETPASQETSPAPSVGISPSSTAQQSSPLNVVSTPVNFKRLGKRIDFKCPHFVGGDAKTCAKLNRLVDKAMNEDADWDLVSMEFAPTFVDRDSVSTAILFYRQGGAHRNGFYEPLNYHLKPSVKPMTVQELFGKQLDIDKLSAISAKYIAVKFKDTKENQKEFYETLKVQDHPFDNFIFDKSGVTFTFCQLTCEAFGVQSLKIPYSELRKFFGKSSPVSQYLKR
jgi:hypothetical protein